LRVQLKHIDENTEKRRHVAKKYMNGLKWISQIELPEIREWSTHTFHLFVIQCEKRDELMKYLKEKWIPTLIHYPISIHKQPFFNGKYSNIELPNLDKQVQKILSLPVHPFMTDEEIDYIILNIKEFYGN
jgi:dTDP-4-amino-4,6-dideoxygalactose transaminase